MFRIEFDHLDSFSQFYSEWRRTSKLFNLKISSKNWVCDFGQNLKITETFLLCFIHQENTSKSFYIRVWTFWLIYTVLQRMKTNFKTSQFEDSCLDLGMQFWSKFEND